jgi:hypothetical protein
VIEEWRAVPGFDHYDVSSLGRVRSRRRAGEPLVMKQKKLRCGYMIVTLCDRGERHERTVHLLVLEAFVGPRPSPAHQARHVLNNRRDDNRLANLCWGTRRENMEDQRRHGTLAVGRRNGMHTKPSSRPTGDRNGRRTKPWIKVGASGERNGQAKITADIVRTMRQRRANGEKLAAIARDFGVSFGLVSVICLRKSWAHVE